MKSLLIAGGGKFGKKAIDYAKKLKYRTILIDRDPNCYASNQIQKKYESLDNLTKDFKEFNEEKILFLNEDISIIYELIKNFHFEYIIPVVPIHLTSLIVKLCLNSLGVNLEPVSKRINYYIDKIEPELLLNYNKDAGLIYLSYAKIDEICPDDCPGPPNYCPNFKREKPITITNYVKKFFETQKMIEISKKKKFANFLLESYQLMAGLGGLKGNELKEVVEKIQKNKNSFISNKYEIRVATTCNCHGIISFLKSKLIQ
ncbi:MAG: hypothetical protein EU543_02870 [Promethearchaeota archaeon]|nr:MAG: hypothetical protein EU543_02870 [Candidatus Lokiarchaeota archaeon]